MYRMTGNAGHVDSARSNRVNDATERTEKLRLNTTDFNVGLIKKLRKMKKVGKLAAWVLDEKRAYRQIPVAPEHRKFAVVAVLDPDSGELCYFVMVGHSFGLLSAVYNYNRRSALLTDILRLVFLVPALNTTTTSMGSTTRSWPKKPWSW